MKTHGPNLHQHRRRMMSMGFWRHREVWIRVEEEQIIMDGRARLWGRLIWIDVRGFVCRSSPHLKFSRWIYIIKSKCAGLNGPSHHFNISVRCYKKCKQPNPWCGPMMIWYVNQIIHVYHLIFFVLISSFSLIKS